MNEAYFAANAYVTVAVAFDRHAEPLIRFAAELAGRLGKRLGLVHVIDAAVLPGPIPLGVPSPVWDALLSAQASSRSAAEKRLAELAKKFSLRATTKVVAATGGVAATIAREADELGSCLLLAGAAYDQSRLIPSGFATGVSLLSSAPMPVMVIDTEKHMPDLAKHSRIVLADDLSEQSENAVSFAAALADGCRAAWVHHVHVSALSPANLQTALMNAAAAAHTSLSDLEARDIYLAVQKDHLARLESRFAGYRERVEASDCKYTSEVIPGGVEPELAAVIKDVSPDALVFGRHKTWHTKPFSFGRMPYRAMLAFKRPVIVVPAT